MPARLTRGQRRAATRSELLTAAERAFARLGFGGASLDRISAEAGLTKGALYYNFDSKEDLFLAVLDEHMARRRALLDRLGSGGHAADLREAARVVAASLAEQREWGLLYLELVAHAGRDARFRRRLVARLAPMVAMVAAALSSMTSGRLAPDELATEARGVVALVDGFALGRLLEPRLDSAVLVRSLELLWSGLDRSA